MTPFDYARAERIEDAAVAAATPGTMLLAGGTTVVDLLRGGISSSRRLVDISRIPDLDFVEAEPDGIRIGALAKMADVAENSAILADYPALAEGLQLAASQQLRNMATVGGNVLQRTRCAYFRDGHSPCNKRSPGSGCTAMDGYNREHAVLGTSNACIATYAGDWGVVLAALDAQVELVSPAGSRTLSFEDLHREPGDRPEDDTNLNPGDVIRAFRIARSPMARCSTYIKIRDRRSYAFALSSAAVGLDMDGDRVADVRIAVGGVATRPWRSREAEAALMGQRLTERSALDAGRAAFAAAIARRNNRVKIELGPRTVAAALLAAASKES